MNGPELMNNDKVPKKFLTKDSQDQSDINSKLSTSCLDESPCDSEVTESVTISATNSFTTKLYAKRYFILGIFILYSASNAFQWIEYAIISNIIEEYYNVSVFFVTSTSVIYMASYIVGIIPATWILEKKGVRFCVLLGSFGNCLGSWIKIMSVRNDRFWVTMIGQTIVAFSQLFILNIPPLLAAVWFSEKELSRATAFGVFGNQMGIALGFFLPPLIVPNYNENTTDSNRTFPHHELDPRYDALLQRNRSIYEDKEVGEGLFYLFSGVAVVTTVIFILIVFFFPARPKYPPTAAQAQAQLVNKSSSFSKSLRNLMTNCNFIILLLTYGLNTGVFYAVSTVLSEMVTMQFGNEKTQAAGIMGAVITIAGVFGSVVCGCILDWTHRYKETTIGVYILSLIGMICFTGALRLSIIWPLFIVSAILGFFMTGYLPIGFEFAAEITYPLPEGTSAGLLNTSAQVFGIAFTFGSSAILQIYGDFVSNIGFVVALLIGTILTSLISADLRRQAAQSPARLSCGKLLGAG